LNRAGDNGLPDSDWADSDMAEPENLHKKPKPENKLFWKTWYKVIREIKQKNEIVIDLHLIS
jgi:hypothetical protein